MSANNNFLVLEHLYHIVGDKDTVERLGPIVFPGRWKIFPLSYWNRGKREGKITIISAGPVGHQVPGDIWTQKLHWKMGGLTCNRQSRSFSKFYGAKHLRRIGRFQEKPATTPCLKPQTSTLGRGSLQLVLEDI